MAGKRDPALVEALVALASRDGLGERVAWEDVRAAITSLDENPLGASDLRRILTRVNDPSVFDTLEDWFIRAASERDIDGQNASRAASHLLVPFQRVSLSTFIGGLVGASIGTFGAAIALPLTIAAALVFLTSTWGSWKLSKRDDQAKRDADSLRRLANIIAAARLNRSEDS